MLWLRAIMLTWLWLKLEELFWAFPGAKLKLFASLNAALATVNHISLGVSHFL